MSPWLYALIPLALVLVLGSAAFFLGYRGHFSDRPGGKSDAPAPVDFPRIRPVKAAPVMREGSRVTSRASDERAVLVQFLDAESESCRAVHPFVEQLKEDFGQQVTFAVRHFPVSEQSFAAALALEAAGEQDRFDDLLEAIYAIPLEAPDGADTKISAGPEENSASAALKYRTIAESLGMDMPGFDAALNDRDMTWRVETDKIDGAALGISSPPSFFLLDGKEIRATTLAEFRQAIAEAASR